jgi:hypothetical protein
LTFSELPAGTTPETVLFANIWYSALGSAIYSELVLKSFDLFSAFDCSAVVDFGLVVFKSTSTFGLLEESLLRSTCQLSPYADLNSLSSFSFLSISAYLLAIRLAISF